MASLLYEFGTNLKGETKIVTKPNITHQVNLGNNIP